MSDEKTSPETKEKTSLLNKWKEKSIGVKTAVYRNTALGEGILAAVLFILAVIFSFDEDVAYFKSGSFFATAGTALLVITALWLFTGVFMLKDPALQKDLSVRTNPAYFTCSFAGFMSFFEAGFRIYTMVKDKTAFDCFDRTISNYSDYRLDRISAVVDIITIVLCALTAVYFFMSSNEKHSNRRMILWGLVPAARAIVGIFQIYFNVGIGMNTPIKLMCEFGLMTVILAVLAEDRMRISDSYAKPNLYIVSQLLCTAVAGAAGIAVVFFYFYYNNDITTALDDTVWSDSVAWGEICVEGAFCLICAVCSFTRVSSYIKYIGVQDEKAAQPENTESQDDNTAEATENETETGTADTSVTPDNEGENIPAEVPEENATQEDDSES